eukprot:GHVO01060090.1.p1 GENE.GHVO01060090.1~~GHVO01060090.1.p1  ORF type:complete len:140 (+),score=10.93 GHVO01060090.1:208-627(+)
MPKVSTSQLFIYIYLETLLLDEDGNLTTYELIHEGVNYEQVKAEYVFISKPLITDIQIQQTFGRRGRICSMQYSNKETTLNEEPQPHEAICEKARSLGNRLNLSEKACFPFLTHYPCFGRSADDLQQIDWKGRRRGGDG